MSKKEFDMIVIGAGPGGYVSAIRGAQLGLNVAIIEKEHMGGICLNWGCIPTKAMLRSSEVFDLVKKAEKYGISVGKVDYDLNSIIKRSRDIGAKLSNGITHLLNKNNITSILGEATLKSKEQDIISKKNVLNPDDFQKKVNDLKNEFVLYKKLADEASKSFNKKKYNSEVALMKSLNLVLSDYSKNNDILIILDKKHILFAKTELEITDKIMNELNKKIKDIKLEK